MYCTLVCTMFACILTHHPLVACWRNYQSDACGRAPFSCCISSGTWLIFDTHMCVYSYMNIIYEQIIIYVIIIYGHIWSYVDWYMIFEHSSYMSIIYGTFWTHFLLVYDSVHVHIWPPIHDYTHMITHIWPPIYDHLYMITHIWPSPYDRPYMIMPIYGHPYDDSHICASIYVLSYKIVHIWSHGMFPTVYVPHDVIRCSLQYIPTTYPHDIHNMFPTVYTLFPTVYVPHGICSPRYNRCSPRYIFVQLLPTT